MSTASHADLYEGSTFNIDGDVQLKLVTLDELPVDAGVKVPETTYSDVVTSLWATWQQSENIRFKAWLRTEFRNYVANRDTNRYRFVDEFAFHELSVEFSNLFNGFVDFKVGRFPLHYGHGLLILESSPLDAERTYGFNGIKSRFKFDRFDLDLIGIFSPREDELLINNKHKKNKFLESDEQGFVAYLQNRSHPWLPKDMYYMYKHEEPRFGVQDIYVHTLGFIWQRDVAESFTSYWELARQFGHRKDGGDTRGWLSDLILTYKWPERDWKPELYIGNYYLSGDDPKTKTEEGWHGLWARWPQYSYLMVWQFIPKLGEWNNLNWTRVGIKLQPWQATGFEANVGSIAAPEKGLGGGKERGDLLIMIMRHQFSARLSVMVRAEIFESGDFHPEEDNTSYTARIQFRYLF